MKLIVRSQLDNTVSDESRTIRGVAIVFDKWSRNLGGYKERILPTAVTQELIDNSDVIANFNHNSSDYMMARSKMGKGTLNLELRSDGLHFSFEAPETEKGNDILWHIRKGNIDECSFAFTLPEDGSGSRWYRDEEGTLCHEVRNIDGLYDVSMVILAAYGDTYCYSQRSGDIEQINAMVQRANDLSEKMDNLINELEDYIIK